MSNIIIVGYGYLGKKVAQSLANNSQHNLYAISRTTNKDDNPVHYISYDLDNSDIALPLAQVFEQASILYLAPPPKQDQSDTRIQQFLNQLKVNKCFPSKIVLISTTGVYGNCKGAWVNEDTPLNPVVDRALRRADAEQQLTKFAEKHNILHTILRIAGIYAEDKLPLARLKNQQPLVQKEESPYSNRIHADDLVNICQQALLGDYSGIFNCSDGHPSTMYDYFSGIATALQLPQPPAISLEQAQEQLSAGMLSYMHESRRIDNSKLLKSFKLKLKYPSFEDFLKSGVLEKK